MTKPLEPQVLPSLRCSMGDWQYFVTSMAMKDVAAWIKKTDQIHRSEQLREWIQRELTDRSNDIVQYLLTQEQRFFNAIIVGVYGGDPEWYPVEVGESPVLGPPSLDERSRSSIGLLQLSGKEKLFAIDGQHRVEAIKLALKEDDKLENEELCVIFVPHHTDRSGLERTRRLFSTLNRYATPVSKGEIVALDEDDAFAITTRRLVEEYSPLSGEFVHFGKTTPIPSSDKKSITSILALYDLVEILNLPRTGNMTAQRKGLTSRRPSSDRLTNIYRDYTAFWDVLQKYVPEIKRVSASSPDDELAGRYRTADGGHVLFRPAGQKAFVRAVRVMIDRHIEMGKAVRLLSKTQLQLEKAPWPNVLWNPHSKKMMVSNPLLHQNLFLHMINQAPQPRKYNLLDEFRKSVGNEGATLDKIKLVK